MDVIINKKVYCLCLINSLLSSTSCYNDSHIKKKNVHIVKTESIGSHVSGSILWRNSNHRWKQKNDFDALMCSAVRGITASYLDLFLVKSLTVTVRRVNIGITCIDPLKVPALIHHVSECWITLFFADSFHAKIF